MILSKALLAILLTATSYLAGAIPTVQSRQNARSYNLPLTWNSYGFLSQISVGTPPQKLPVFVDWTWVGQYLLTTLCHGNSSDTYDCLATQQPLFNQSLSSSFRNLTSQYGDLSWDPNHFFFWKPLTVDISSDIVTVGPSSTRMIIQAADFQFNETAAAFPFAGVYGLSPVFKTDNKTTESPFYQAWRAGAWPEPYVAFHYCYNGSVDTNKTTCGGHDGLQTLGGYNSRLVKGGVTWYDVIQFPEVNVVDFVYNPALLEYWAVGLTQFSIGDEVQPLNTTVGSAAVFDHASYGRGAPMSVNAYQKLINLSGATPIKLDSPPNNGNQSWYQIDCNKTQSLPPLKYQFSGSSKVWEIIPSNYVEKLDNGVCVLNVRTLGDGDWVIGNFGETFSKDKYVIFDFEKLKVGLADLNWR
ncbi:hypothetical protein DTO169E5_1971 [Paecilomyces variotii]|nr:hypothetical protein DTO169E5_1971 [Paecilomyces variotii]